MHYQARTTSGIQWGSGFILAPWTWSIVTAGHVLTLDAGTTAVRVQVFFEIGSTHFVIDATSFAVGPPSPTTDCAVVRLAAAVPTGTQLAHRGVPTGSFDARVVGYPDGSTPRVDLPTGARESNGLIIYDADVGLDGMSGGPVLVDGKAVGIHIGQARGRIGQGATPIDLDLLDSLMKAARAAG
jgi:hypothetical protein